MNRSTFAQILVPVIILILFVVGIFGVLRLRNNTSQPPTLDVAVEDNSTTTNDKLDVSGSTNAKDVTVNNNKVNVGEDGTFTYSVPLNPGENKITFNAEKNGKTTETTRTVTRQVSAAAATPVPNSGGLSDSGPAQDFGIVALAGLILSSYFYIRSRKNKEAKPSYKLFTNSHI